MRTTITLDDDVAVELEQRRRADGRTFKDIVNDTLRAGLHTVSRQPEHPVRYTIPHDLGSAPDISDVSAVLAMMDEEKYAHVAEGVRP